MKIPTPFQGKTLTQILAEAQKGFPEGVEAYPSRIGVFCDECGKDVSYDYVVHDGMTKSERFGVARAHLSENEGWSCTEEGDLCPGCQKE